MGSCTGAMLGIALLLSIPLVTGALIAPKVPYPEGPQGALLIMKMEEALERGRQDGASMVHVSAMLYYTPAFKHSVNNPVHHIQGGPAGCALYFVDNKIRFHCLIRDGVNNHLCIT